MTWKCTNTPKGENKLYSDAKGVVPSLDLRFAEGKNLNDYMTATPLVDHQRNMNSSTFSPGTFVNSNGVIETAQANYALYSETLTDSWWSGGQFTSISDTTDVNPPTGIQNIYKVTETADTGEHFFRGSQITLALTAGVPNGTVVTHSIYLNTSLGRSKIRVYIFGLNNLTFIWDLVNNVQIGTIGGGTSPTINSQSLGNNWYRFSFTDVATVSSNLRPSFQTVNDLNQFNYTGDTTKGFYASGFQVEIGSTATTYIPTTNLPSAAPRFDHDPTTGESLGLLIEESRTNYITDQVPTFTIGSGTVITYNAFTAPDGTNTAIRVQGNSGSVTLPAATVPSGTSLIASYYIYSSAAITGLTNRLTYGLANTGSFDLPAGQWVRVTTPVATDPGTNTAATLRVLSAMQNASAAVDVYVWGFQLEEGSFATSYIPTAGTALTRNVDVASITGTNFSSWYNQSEGTTYLDFSRPFAPVSSKYWYSFSGSNVITQRHSVYQPANLAVVATTNDGTPQATFSIAGSFSNKHVYAYKLNDYAACVDGGTVGTDTTATVPAIVKLNIGSFGNGFEQPNGTISRLTYFPERLPDSSLQTMTTP